ncbi:cache domain-containing protein [Rhodopseudomonas palustris]|uniref:Double Cache domain-containing protein n=1 Tax=Rhodopseudomonas palustris (strain BisB18) TaxID=316056 RepID=Q214Y4_RHOPB
MDFVTDGTLRPSKAPTLPWLWVGIATALVLAIGFGAMIAITFSMQTEMIARDRDNQMAAVSEAITAALDQAGKFALTQAETTARRASVGRALAAGNRAELLALTAGTYGYLKTQSVPVFGFHSADMKYLLRLHLPENFGDDLTRIRPMVLAANKSRRSQVGLEIGIAGTFVRGIAIVENGADFVGTVEAGLNLQPILEQVKSISNADIAIVLSQSFAGLPARGPNDKGVGEVFGDLNLFASTDSPLFAALLRDGAIRLVRSREVAERQIQGQSGAVLVQPLIDFSGRMIGNVVAAKSFAYHGAELRRTQTELIAAALIGAILAFVVFSILARMIAIRAGWRP